MKKLYYAVVKLIHDFGIGTVFYGGSLHVAGFHSDGQLALIVGFLEIILAFALGLLDNYFFEDK